MTAAGEETFAHGPVKVPVEDLEPIKIFRGRISEQQRFWEDLAKERAENANLPQRRWSIQCNDQLALETRRINSRWRRQVGDPARLAATVQGIGGGSDGQTQDAVFGIK